MLFIIKLGVIEPSQKTPIWINDLMSLWPDSIIVAVLESSNLETLEVGKLRRIREGKGICGRYQKSILANLIIYPP